MIKSVKLITASSFLAMFFMGVGSAIIGAAARDIGLTAAQIGLLLYQEMAGTVLGTIKVGIPLGGIITPFIMALIAGYISTQAALVIFPLSLLFGFLLLLQVMRLMGGRKSNAT